MNILTITVGENPSAQSLLRCEKIQIQYFDNNCFDECKEEADHYAIVMGLPCDGTLEEFESLFEPVRNECEHLLYLYEETSTEFCGMILTQRKCFCLAKFTTIPTRNVFCMLYNNMPMDQYKECAPCLAFPINTVKLQYNLVYHHSLLSCYPIFVLIVLQEKLERKKLPNNGEYIPTCTLCIRRIRTNNRIFLKTANSISTEDGQQDIIVGRSFVSHCEVMTAVVEKRDSQNCSVLVRCLVCYTYNYNQCSGFQQSKSSIDTFLVDLSSSSATASDDLRSPVSSKAKSPPNQTNSFPMLGGCMKCHLLENIWICLVCGCTGCGRYTSQHAFDHFSVTRHAYALELVSGRIWDYMHDEFVHYENNSSAFGGILNQFTQYSKLSDFQGVLVSDRSNPPIVPSGAKALHSIIIEEEEPSLSLGKILISEEHLMEQQRLRQNVLTNDTLGKMDVISIQYEKLIEIQLQDQRLHYEKLLARETVKAMEYSMDKHRSRQTNFQNSENVTVAASHGDELLFDAELDKEFQEMEDMKLVTSQVEQELKAFLDEMKIIVGENKSWKKENEILLNEQKIKKDELSELTKSKEEIKLGRQQQIEDLQQQIRDLEFYISTKNKMEASPLKDELEGATIVTQVKPAAEENNGAKKSKYRKGKN